MCKPRLLLKHSLELKSLTCHTFGFVIHWPQDRSDRSTNIMRTWPVGACHDTYLLFVTVEASCRPRTCSEWRWKRSTRRRRWRRRRCPGCTAAHSRAPSRCELLADITHSHHHAFIARILSSRTTARSDSPTNKLHVIFIFILAVCGCVCDHF